MTQGGDWIDARRANGGTKAAEDGDDETGQHGRHEGRRVSGLHANQQRLHRPTRGVGNDCSWQEAGKSQKQSFTQDHACDHPAAGAQCEPNTNLLDPRHRGRTLVLMLNGKDPRWDDVFQFDEVRPSIDPGYLIATNFRGVRRPPLAGSTP